MIDALLQRVPAHNIGAGLRDPDKEAAVAVRHKGVEVGVADYSRPETLKPALGRASASADAGHRPPFHGSG